MSKETTVSLKKWTGVKETDFYVDVISPKSDEEGLQLVLKSGSGRVQARILSISIAEGITLIPLDEDARAKLPDSFVDGEYVSVLAGRVAGA